MHVNTLEIPASRKVLCTPPLCIDLAGLPPMLACLVVPKSYQVSVIVRPLASWEFASPSLQAVSSALCCLGSIWCLLPLAGGYTPSSWIRFRKVGFNTA
jgi:hypothetical protein